MISKIKIPLLALKIGGSLFSDKFSNRKLNDDMLNRYSDLVASLYRSLAGRMVFISGGGSYGHQAVREMRKGETVDNVKLSEANFLLKLKWHHLFLKRGIKSYPLQLAANAICDGKDSIYPHIPVFESLLASRFLPVLSGDSLLDQEGGIHIVGSDDVSGICNKITSGQNRVVMLTNVEGVLNSKDARSSTTIQVVDQTSDIANIVWATEPGDTSNAMRGKIAAMLRHAKSGAECIIMSGEDCISSPLDLTRPLQTWKYRNKVTLVNWQGENLTRQECY